MTVLSSTRPMDRTLSRGFTLIETLAAAMLASLLFLTMLTVIGSIGRERRVSDVRARMQLPTGVTELIRWDCANAREIETGKGWVKLTGYGALDPTDFAPANHRDATVHYEVRSAAGTTWLMRRQTGAIESTELVCSGVAEMALTEIKPKEKPKEPPKLIATHTPATQPATQPTTQPTTQPNLSAAVRLQIRWVDRKRPEIDQVMVLR